jgi:ubiquinone/menaquinone biosynthesis C-methylase UbiE
MLGKIYNWVYTPPRENQNEKFRNEWVESKLLELPQGSTILDAGAGECRYKKNCSHLKYTSQDFGQYDGKGDGGALQTGKWDTSRIDIVSNIENIPVEENSFDSVICTEVFEHLPNPQNALKEFSRILKPKGTLILTAPFCSLTHFSPYHFCTGFNKYWYEYHMDKYGLEIIEINQNGNFFDYMIQENHRIFELAPQFAKMKVNRFSKFCILYLLRFLKKCSIKDAGSNELLCFGYHVLAKKK